MVHTVGFTSSDRYECLEDLQKDSASMCLTYCGWENCEPCHRFGPNQRESYVLHIIKNGKGILEMNEEVYHLKTGDVFYIPPKTEAWYEADAEDPWSYFWMGFVGIKAEEYVANAGFAGKHPVRHITCTEKLKEYVDQMLEAHQLSYENELKRNGLLFLAFSALIEDYHTHEKTSAPFIHQYPGAVYAKHAMEYMMKHYNKRLKINEMADYIGVNRSYLTSTFKKNVGCSPQEFLVNLRMEKAKALLKETDLSVNAVANSVGYCDQLAFSKAFKQHCGKSPRAYKNEECELVVKNKKGTMREN